MTPSYLSLYQSGDLANRIKVGLAALEHCELCPRRCGVDRVRGEVGFCGVGRRSVVASFNPHFGEEAPLVGEHGSGTIFFAGCNLGCRFCQNYDISHDPSAGIEAAPDELAGVMLSLQREQCHNINFVTPSHIVPQILEALPIAIEHGLNVPLVYNSSGYDSVEALKLLDGVVDIYMPDLKMWNPDHAARYLRARDYPDAARSALTEMHRQVGDLVVNDDGIAERGLLVRHLVMPDDIAGTDDCMAFLSTLSHNTYINIMDQYRPCGEARNLEGIDRMITSDEYGKALASARRHGLTRLDERSDLFLRRLLK